MKTVTVSSAKLKRDGVDGVDLDGKCLYLDQPVRVSAKEYERVQEMQSAWEEQFGVSVEVGDEKDDEPSEPQADATEAPGPDPEGTTKSRSR